MADYQSKSVVTVGTRATLPSIYVENETSGSSVGGATSLRYRNRIHDDDLNNNVGVGDNNRLKFKSLESPDVASLGSSIRSTPSYGTPGTTASLSSYAGEYQLDSPDSGFKTPRAVRQGLAQIKGTRNPLGSYVEETPMSSVTTTSGVDVKHPEVQPSHEDQIKAKLEELHRRWRHHQRRAALFGTSEAFTDVFESVTDLDAVKDLLPIIVTTIIIASCVVTICLLSAGLVRNPTGVKMPENLNGKYLSIEYGRSKLNDRLARTNRLPPKEIKDEFGNILGGKRAAIQFAYNLRSQLNGEVPDETPAATQPTPAEVEPKAPESETGESDDVLDELSIKVASKVVNLVDTLSKTAPAAGSEEAAERAELLKKLRSFSNFATSKLEAPKELEPKPELAGEAKPAEEKSQPEAEAKPTSEATPEPSKVDLKAEVKVKADAKKPAAAAPPPAKPVPAPARAKRTPKVDPFKKFLKPEAEKSPKAESPKTGPPKPEKIKTASEAGKAAKVEDDPFRSLKSKEKS